MHKKIILIAIIKFLKGRAEWKKLSGMFIQQKPWGP